MKASHSFLLFDGDGQTHRDLEGPLTNAGYLVSHATSADSAVRRLREHGDVELVLVDAQAPRAHDFIRRARCEAPRMAIIAILAEPELDCAIGAMRSGADDCVFRPVEGAELLTRVQRLLESIPARVLGVPGIVGVSTELDAIRRTIAAVAESPAPCVLITGESGTGKDLVARSIHEASSRSGPFVNINCSALPETLLESELFGHEPGAFTGATRLKKGLFELANGGTAFLDEIGDMAVCLQAKILRFTEERAFRRLGGSAESAVDTRVLAATHRDLAAAVADGSFREDLYYRLHVVHIEIPPLRDRVVDIEALARHFVGRFARAYGKPVAGIESSALRRLERHSWPGNVRELKHTIERAVLACRGEELEVGDLAFSPRGRRTGFKLPPGGVVLEDLERELLLQALERENWHCGRAARLLGLNREQVRYRIDKFRMVPPVGVGVTVPDSRAATH